MMTHEKDGNEKHYIHVYCSNPMQTNEYEKDVLTGDGTGNRLGRDSLALEQSEAHACSRIARTCMYPTIRSQAGLYWW